MTQINGGRQPLIDFQASKEFITSSTFAEMDEDQNGKVNNSKFFFLEPPNLFSFFLMILELKRSVFLIFLIFPGDPSFFLFLFLSSLCQVTLDEFTTAILAREQFSKMLTLKIIDIFVEDE